MYVADCNSGSENNRASVVHTQEELQQEASQDPQPDVENYPPEFAAPIECTSPNAKSVKPTFVATIIVSCGAAATKLVEPVECTSLSVGESAKSNFIIRSANEASANKPQEFVILELPGIKYATPMDVIYRVLKVVVTYLYYHLLLFFLQNVAEELPNPEETQSGTYELVANSLIFQPADGSNAVNDGISETAEVEVR